MNRNKALTSFFSDILSRDAFTQMLGESISGFAIHSEETSPGDIFLALKSTNENALDGTAYIPDAIQRGAKAVLWEKGAVAPKPYFFHQVPLIEVPNLRKKTEKIMSYLSSGLPEHLFGVTGTNGKTSVVSLVSHILSRLETPAVSIGTLGVRNAFEKKTKSGSSLTTPSLSSLYKTLETAHQEGINYAAMEVSSHGLHQWRVAGLKYEVAAFTSFSRDHFDYHKTEEAYLDAKMMLFENFLAKDGVAVINRDMHIFDTVLSRLKEKKIKRIITYGKHPEADLRLVQTMPLKNEQQISASFEGKTLPFLLPLVGEIQAYNALCAFAVILASKKEVSFDHLVQTLYDVPCIPGRLEKLSSRNDVSIYVDYAHTPDSLQATLSSLRPYTEGRLITVFGAGGDRDVGKRPLMGEAACKEADIVIITDDNPRTEKPEGIRRDILAGCNKDAIEIPLRVNAILKALEIANPGDTVILMGKGHENYQLIGGKKVSFDERALVQSLDKRTLLWTKKELLDLFRIRQNPLENTYSVSIDHRNILPGDLFVCLQGRNFDGHDFISDAVSKGANGIVSAYLPPSLPFGSPAYLTSQPQSALELLASCSRNRNPATFIGITGSSGKTSIKELTVKLLSLYGKSYISPKNYNNRIGLSLSLANLHRDEHDYCVLELGMNHSGEIRHLTKISHPNVRVISNIGTAHIGNFFSKKAIAKAKAEIFEHAEANTIAVIPTDFPFYKLLERKIEKEGIRQVVSFGRAEGASIRLLSSELVDNRYRRAVISDSRKEVYTFDIDALEDHHVENLLCSLAILSALELPLSQVPKKISPPLSQGRGDSVLLRVPHSPDKRFRLIDQSYNANPQSMKAALHSLGLAPVQEGGRRLLVLGDMLELGRRAHKLHTDLMSDIFFSNADKIWLVGKHIKSLAPLLDKSKIVGEFDDLETLRASLLSTIDTNDVVMIKSSFGIGLGNVATFLKETYGLASEPPSEALSSRPTSVPPKKESAED